MSPLDAGMIGFFVVVLAVLGSTPVTIELNGRELPNRPQWWLMRGVVALLGMLMMMVSLLLMPVIFTVAIVHDAVWPRGKRWVRASVADDEEGEP